MERTMDNEQLALNTAIRASDADRERTLEVLRRHHVEGRLDASEFQARLDACLQAKTLDELRALSIDLPREDAEHAWRATVARRPATWRLAIASIVLFALIVASAFAERPLFFPAVPFLFFWLRGFWWHGDWHRQSMLGGQDMRVLR
jgi:hypothetical protein